jgi:acyl carrier protein
MSNKEKYDDAFAEGLSIDKAIVKPGLKYNEIPEWDSIGHMSLIGALEEKFGISMDTSDIVEFGSYEKGIEIMKKYQVEV